MGRRYYCEYCDKSFLDDFDAREKHIKGAHHQRMRKQHYDSFRGMYVQYV
jgi:U11/U12 small nuclear ribonucleoprotein SNRNP20